MIKIALMSAALLFSFGASAQMLDAFPEISGQEREVAAKAALDAPNTVVLYAKGLCCPSCAIGIRKMLSKLSFVDLTRYNKGVELDPKTQLVRIAIKPGQQEEMKALKEAILDAGYDAVHLFKLTKGALEVKEFASAKVK